jgi:soluble lytic murein transglycosylase-like protein
MPWRKPILAVFVWTISTGAISGEGNGYLATLGNLAAQGNPKALTELAIRYEHAEGVPRDYAKAIDMYCQAAKQNYAEAQYRLGWMLANGRGVPRDDGLAALWFSMAAKQGHNYAQQMMKYLGNTAPSVSSVCLTPGERAGAVPAEERALTRKQIEALVYRLAPQYSVDPQLALAIIAVESTFAMGARSPKNAGGLMQIVPATAMRFKVKNVFNPAENIRGGLAYLRWLLAFFKGNVPLVLAAYNAGEGTVERYGGIPPYPETQNYIQKVTRFYKKARHPYLPHVISPSPIVLAMETRQEGPISPATRPD